MHEAHRLNQQNQIMVAHILVDRQRRRRPRPRRYWVRPWLSRRLDYGHYDTLMRELEAEDVVSFRNFFRMDPAMFREVLQRVGPRIEKYDTWYRKAINPGCRLAITLRLLATGEKYRNLNGGSLCYNYMGFHSVILLALVDYKYKFQWVDVGTNGSSSDTEIFNDCDLHSGIVDGTLDIPDAEPLPGDDRDMPYFLIGDDTFSLRTPLMKPLASWSVDLVVFSPP